MQELITLINALASFLSKFGVVGWLVLGVGILLWKGKDILNWLDDKILKRIAPIWHDNRKLRLEQIRQSTIDTQRERQEQIQHQRELQAQEQINTTMMWKNLILEYRKRLDNDDLALNRLQQKVFDVVAQNEKLNAQVLESLREYRQQNERIYSHIVEALRDVSGVLRAQTARLDILSGKGEKSDTN